MKTQVNYDALDAVKLRCIEACKKTLTFAGDYGKPLTTALGASSNIFSLDLEPFIKLGATKLYLTQLPEGLGTADDARPEDLTPEEQKRFWNNIAFKTVSTLTNDACTAGVQTILLSLYLPSATPETVFTEGFLDGFLEGIVKACKQVGCVYFSGETPQLKSKIFPDRLDIAGSLFGIVPPGIKPITGEDLAVGDKIVLLESSGPHENGFTPLRALAEKLPNGYRTKLPSGIEYWEAINAPSVLYTPIVQAILKQGINPTNIENITGHGWQKLMRSKKPFAYRIKEMLPIKEVFEFVKETSGFSYNEILKVYNCGVGMAIFVKSDSEAFNVVETAKRFGVNAVVAGEVESSPDVDSRSVIVDQLHVELKGSEFALGK